MAGMQVFIDPFLFMTPVEGSRETINHYFNNIKCWAACLDQEEEDFFTSRDCIYALGDVRRFPSFGELKILINKYDLNEWAAYDLNNSLSRLSRKGPFVEERTGIESISADVILFEPQILLERLGLIIGKKLCNALSICVSSVQDVFQIGSLVFGTADIDEFTNKFLRISVKIDLIEYSSGEIIQINEENRNDIQFLFDPSVLFDVDSVDLLKDPQGAISFYYKRFSEDERKDHPLSVIIGPNFGQSLFDLGIIKNRQILSKICRFSAFAALGKLHQVRGAKLHPVRTSEACDAPQVEKNGAKKWRCDLTTEGAGYRMHYWKGPGGTIELDSVMTESKAI